MISGLVHAMEILVRSKNDSITKQEDVIFISFLGGPLVDISNPDRRSLIGIVSWSIPVSLSFTFLRCAL